MSKTHPCFNPSYLIKDHLDLTHSKHTYCQTPTIQRIGENARLKPRFQFMRLKVDQIVSFISLQSKEQSILIVISSCVRSYHHTPATSTITAIQSDVLLSRRFSIRIRIPSSGVYFLASLMQLIFISLRVST